MEGENPIKNKQTQETNLEGELLRTLIEGFQEMVF